MTLITRCSGVIKFANSSSLIEKSSFEEDAVLEKEDAKYGNHVKESTHKKKVTACRYKIDENNSD